MTELLGTTIKWRGIEYIILDIIHDSDGIIIKTMEYEKYKKKYNMDDEGFQFGDLKDEEEE